MDKNKLSQFVEDIKDDAVSMAFSIFDNPEADGKEYYASDLLANKLETLGFSVERGVGGLETAFRAVYKIGEGGPNIGFIAEYDALPKAGHVCGHHMQTPAAIAAAYALVKAYEKSDEPFVVTVYGTPAEETFGGKIIMLENGCFKELDIALGTHATAAESYVNGGSLALHTYNVTFKGRPAHASSKPFEGRSALDAMLLSFNGIEFMREHVRDDCRMHYTVSESTGPTNAVHETAKGRYVLRSRSNSYLEDMARRFRNIIDGACLMTETTAEIEKLPAFAANRPNKVLKDVICANLRLIGIEKIDDEFRIGGGSTDFGNVSTAVPSALTTIPYCDAPGHSREWYDAGKTEAAVKCLVDSAKLLAYTASDIIERPSIAAEAKVEYESRKG